MSSLCFPGCLCANALKRDLLLNTGSLALQGKCQWLNHQQNPTSIPWEVCAVRNKFNSGTVIDPGFEGNQHWPKVYFMSPETAFMFKLQPFISTHANTAATEGIRTRLKWPCHCNKSEALLACALLFVPPVVPSCCDVKAAIQSREKGNRGLSSHQQPGQAVVSQASTTLPVWQSCAFHAWVTWLNGGNPMLSTEWSPKQAFHPERLKHRLHCFQGLNGTAALLCPSCMHIQLLFSLQRENTIIGGLD